MSRDYVAEYFGGVTVGDRTVKRIRAALRGDKFPLTGVEITALNAIRKNIQADRKR